MIAQSESDPIDTDLSMTLAEEMRCGRETKSREWNDQPKLEYVKLKKFLLVLYYNSG